MKEIKLDASAADTSETTTNYIDSVGRNYKTTFAAASSPWPYRESFYNNVGQLIRERDADGVTTLYAYDAEGERDTTAISTNQDTSINYSGDRITKTISDVATIDGVNVVRTRTYQWFTNGSTVSNLVAETRASTDGRRNWDIRFGLTKQTAIHYPGGGYEMLQPIAWQVPPILIWHQTQLLATYGPAAQERLSLIIRTPQHTLLRRAEAASAAQAGHPHPVLSL